MDPPSVEARPRRLRFRPQYLVKGMREWVAGWEARGWKRKGGVLENQELWKKLVQAAAAHQVEWRWIEGHAGHAKNEYADTLATRAAERQERSNGLVPPGLHTWLVKAPGSVRDKVVFVSASPCVMCAKLIINSGVTHAFYRKAYRDPSGIEVLQQGGIVPVLYDKWVREWR